MPGQLCVPVRPGGRSLAPRPQLQKHLRRFPSVSISSYAVSHSKKCIGLGSYTDLHDIQARKLLLRIWVPSVSGLFFLSRPQTQPDLPTRHQGRA